MADESPEPLTMEERVQGLPALLEWAWKEGRMSSDFRSFGQARPLAHTDLNQYPTTTNPYWEAVRWLPASSYSGRAGDLRPEMAPLSFADPWRRRLVLAGARRDVLTSLYSWSIPTPADLEWMKTVLDGRAVVEIGAGTGYWAWQLEQMGVDVAAYDPFPPGEDNRWCKGGPYTTVLRDDASAARHHPDRALVLIWPPYDDPAGTHALASYSGDLLFYAGEGDGGCTADDAFHEILHDEWEEVDRSARHVTWWGIHCELVAYRRR